MKVFKYSDIIKTYIDRMTVGVTLTICEMQQFNVLKMPQE